MSVLNGKGPQKRYRDTDFSANRLAAVGQIAAGIAHEVKNPLTAVKGFIQLMQEESPNRYLDLAYSELENALLTLQNLLNVSKPDLEDEPHTTINLCSELESLLYLFQEKSYDIKIETKFADTNQTIYGKRNQLKKVFFNLLKNAFEAIPEQGTITIEHFKMGTSVIVKISDTGIGIPQEKIALLGTPFFTSKVEGTGMGLTQVFSTVYDHLGEIYVRSAEGVGTTFTIHFPVQIQQIQGVKKMPNLNYIENQSFIDFWNDNKEQFFKWLTADGKEILTSIKDFATNIDEEYVLRSANEIITLLNDLNEHGLILQAKEHGKNWAKFNMELILKLEWFQILRKNYWEFLYNYYENAGMEVKTFFDLERNVNFNLDTYIKHFSSSFTEYKNELLNSQREVINDLTVPVIPIADAMAILPVVGTIDTLRAKRIQENVLKKIYELKIRYLIVDLSGVAYLDTAVVAHLFKIVNGISIQGCKAVITGIRPEITNTMIELGIALHEKVETRGTLQQAIEEFTLNK